MEPIKMQFDRRKFVQMMGALSATATVRAAAQTTADEAAHLRPAQRGTSLNATPMRKNVVGTQVKAYAWQDEGIDKLLDNLQEKGNVNTVYAFTFLTGSGRIEQGGPIQLPDHGKYGAVDIGGAYYDADPKFFANTTLKGGHSPDPFNVIAEVGPKMKARGMDFIAWDYNNTSPTMPTLFPGFQDVCEIDIYGRRTDGACWNHPNYRAQLTGRISSYLSQYPNEVAGIMWGCERMGPLDNLIGGGWSTQGISCFCEFCRAKGHERGIAVERAREGFIQLDNLFKAAKKQQRPSDGYFISFWRTLLEYPEVLSWQTLWNDSYHEVRGELYGTAKTLAPRKPFGFHMVQNITFSPFYSAADDYRKIKNYSDFIKIATYSNSGGERMAGFISHLCSTIFADSTPQVFTPVYYNMMGYNEKPYEEIVKDGLSAEDYVGGETRRALADTGHETQVYASIDINVPMPQGSTESTPERVKAEVNAALGAGADGIVLSREYTEMWLSNLKAAGDASRAAFAAHRP
jgi:hypothetical protein